MNDSSKGSLARWVVAEGASRAECLLTTLPRCASAVRLLCHRQAKTELKSKAAKAKAAMGGGKGKKKVRC